MSQLLDPNWDRASILPIGRNRQTGKLGPAVPQVLADLLSAVMLPGDVYQGNVLLRDEGGQLNPEVIRRSTDLAGAMTLGAGAIPAQPNSLRMGLRAAAIRHKGKVYEGRTHNEAIAKATQATGDYIHRDYVDQGFITDKGKYLDRADPRASLEALSADQIHDALVRSMVENDIRSNSPYSSLIAESVRFPQ